MRERLAVFLLTFPAGIALGWQAKHWWLKRRYRHGLVLPEPTNDFQVFETVDEFLERMLRELVDGVRILDVMLREPAAEGLMSAEDYRSYLSGAWLGVDEKTAAARAVLSARIQKPVSR